MTKVYYLLSQKSVPKFSWKSGGIYLRKENSPERGPTWARPKLDHLLNIKFSLKHGGKFPIAHFSFFQRHYHSYSFDNYQFEIYKRLKTCHFEIWGYYIWDNFFMTNLDRHYWFTLLTRSLSHFKKVLKGKVMRNHQQIEYRIISLQRKRNTYCDVILTIWSWL